MPPEYVLELLPVEVLGFVAVVAALIWIGGKVRRVLAVVNAWAARARRIVLDWEGEPGDDGHEARPGVMARLRAYDERVEGMTVGLREVKEVQAEHTEQLVANAEALVVNVTAVAESKAAVAEVAEALAEVRHNVKPNSGTSAHDAIVKQLDGLRELVVDMMGALGGVAGEVHRLRDDYDRALAHNHPDYEPDLRADRNID